MRGIGSIGLLGIGTLLAVVAAGVWFVGLLFGSLHAAWLFGDFDFRDVEFGDYRHVAVLAVPWVIVRLILVSR